MVMGRASESGRADSAANLRQPEMTEADAEAWLDHFYALADVTVEAFIEQRSGRSESLMPAA